VKFVQIMLLLFLRRIFRVRLRLVTVGTVCPWRTVLGELWELALRKQSDVIALLLDRLPLLVILKQRYSGFILRVMLWHCYQIVCHY